MKAVLSFIYTGSMPQAHAYLPLSAALFCAGGQPETLFRIAGATRQQRRRAGGCGGRAQAGRAGTLAEQAASVLAVDNVKGFLQLAHLHEAPELKAACVTYVKRHAATVLVQPDVMKLATEQPQLWAELAGKISSNGGATTRPASKKRART